MADDELVPESPITLTELTVGLVDDFHDWIDGDDWVKDVDHTIDGHGGWINVEFASGRIFAISIQAV